MSEQELVLVYDQECPFCAAYVRMVRIRESVGNLVLLDAREGGDVVEQITRQGLDIDQGMVLKMSDQFYYGADAIHALSLISSRSGLFNRFNYWVFRSLWLSSLLYPILRFGRNLVLKILGRSKINNLGVEGNDRF